MHRSPSNRTLLAVIILAALTLTAMSHSADAQVYGVWSDPAPLPKGDKIVGAHLLLGDLTGLMGQVRFGVTPNADLGIQLGLPDFDADFALAADWRQLILPKSDSFPMDMAFDGAFGWAKLGEGASLIDFAFGVIVSDEIATQGGMTFIPYGSLMIDIGRASVDVPDEVQSVPGVDIDSSATSTDVIFRGGVQAPMNEQFGLNGELQLASRSNGFYVTLGATYGF